MQAEDKSYDINACLSDIEQSIIEIYDFISSENDFLKFSADIKSKKAVERNIEIIGEAMDRILKTDPGFPISNSRKIVDTRNRIIHGYDSVSADVLWLIITRYLPVLEKEVRDLLNKHWINQTQTYIHQVTEVIGKGLVILLWQGFREILFTPLIEGQKKSQVSTWLSNVAGNIKISNLLQHHFFLVVELYDYMLENSKI